jgi:hypothetical protein
MFPEMSGPVQIFVTLAPFPPPFFLSFCPSAPPDLPITKRKLTSPCTATILSPMLEANRTLVYYSYRYAPLTGPASRRLRV